VDFTSFYRLYYRMSSGGKAFFGGCLARDFRRITNESESKRKMNREAALKDQSFPTMPVFALLFRGCSLQNPFIQQIYAIRKQPLPTGNYGNTRRISWSTAHSRPAREKGGGGEGKGSITPYNGEVSKKFRFRFHSVMVKTPRINCHHSCALSSFLSGMSNCSSGHSWSQYTPVGLG